ncbi:AbrB/MazE/SpoVT family DNA-binding domain-containing protein [Arthrobacter sp. TMN-50]
MVLAKVTSKGQVTIPLEVRQKLALEPGSRVDFVLTAEGKLMIEPVESSVRSLEGIFHEAGRDPVSLDEMDRSIAAEASEMNGDQRPRRAT